MATYTDNFNRANEDPLSGDWSTDLNAGLAIVSNQVKRATGSSPAMSSLDSLTWDNDQTAEIEYASHSNFDILGVGVRFSGTGNGYIGFADDGRGYIARVTAGSRTLLDTNFSVTITAGDVFRLEVTGTSLELFQNDVSICTATDATYSSGAAGLYYDAGNSNLTLGDNFVATGQQAGDSTAPVLSSPTGTKTGKTTADGTVSTDEGNGTLYYYASTNSSESAATIKASGSSQAVSGTGSQSVSFTGLTAGTGYYAHYVHDDAAANESNVVSSSQFTTDPALAIDTAPSTVYVVDNNQIVVSNPDVAPTTGNTTVKLDGSSGVTGTVTSVTGSGPYTINFNFGRTTAKLFDATGYTIHLTIGAETIESSEIPYEPQSGWSYVTIASVDTGSDIYTDYSGPTPANNDQGVYETYTDPDAQTVTVFADLNWSIPDQSADQTSDFYLIEADGTVGAQDTITWTAPVTPSAPTMPADTSVNVAENATTVGTFAASSGSPAPTYSLSGTDAALFSINSSTAAVTFDSAPDYESDPLSYSITVTATNSEGSDSQNITVNVTNVVETPVLASTLALSGTVDSAFSRTLSIQSGDAATSWTITGGADQASYSINSSGVLSRTAPNDTEESEVVTVTATNSAGTSNTQTVTITYSEASYVGTNSIALSIGISI